jgi:dephospho-CoA kinase
MLPKLLILGHGRHGKDTFAEILRDNFGLKFVSSSQAAADIFIYDELKDKYGYETPEECYEDRSNHRPEWYQLICDYNKEDRTKLAQGILDMADCYVGMRDRDEIEACMSNGLFDLIIWVDASERLPLESADSFNIDKSCADIIIENNTTLEDFTEKVLRIGRILENNTEKVL